MPRRRGNASKAWSMQPSLHDDVCDSLSEDDLSIEFFNRDDPRSSIKDYDTNVMGTFNCNNSTCSSNGWSSKKIAVSIRLYSGQRYNARVYHQRCRQCKSCSEPTLDESYAERVAYRLKKRSGIAVSPPVYNAESKGPHQRHLCEGCKHGHCSEGCASTR